uniref:Scavenger receptor class F member 2 n=1 Tax=Magallana gigas TaxID=29159 RepID=A0A8W8P5Y6_MAGGI
MVISKNDDVLEIRLKQLMLNHRCPEPGYDGWNCSLLCPENCQDDQCYAVNKTCLSCVAGYIGSKCIEVCETGKYGIDCQQRCSAFCHTSGICHHITGACKDGCKSGWKGAECLEVQDDGKTSTTLYVVVASLVVLVISNVVLVLYVIVLRKHRKKQKKHKTYEQTKKENVFTQDISGYDSVVSRTEENYQELATVTADR